MRVIYGASPNDVSSFDTARLRAEFLIEGLFAPGGIEFAYTHLDRMIGGAACPAETPLSFGDGADVGTPLFFTAREMGIANLGGPGRVTVDWRDFPLANSDILYVGHGAEHVTLASDDPAHPARLYTNSVPAGRDIPHRLIPRDESKPLDLGEEARANKRRLRMYIHPEVAPSSLLLMGITALAPGSVWNTMPPHLHERRMEAYCYFNLADADRVIHIMGRPDETRNLIVANGDVVLSPAWSIHMGGGTGPYSFAWGMTGETRPIRMSIRSLYRS